MQTVIVQLKKDQARDILDALEKMDILKIVTDMKKNSVKTFNAVKLSTKGFKFNRDEANQR